jgi:hypothetical protein
MVNLQSQAFHPFFVFPDFGFSAFPIEAPPFASCAASAGLVASPPPREEVSVAAEVAVPVGIATHAI